MMFMNIYNINNYYFPFLKTKNIKNFILWELIEFYSFNFQNFVCCPLNKSDRNEDNHKFIEFLDTFNLVFGHLKIVMLIFHKKELLIIIFKKSIQKIETILYNYIKFLCIFEIKIIKIIQIISR